ncbi:MAG: hypothetical protein IAE80_22455 [Anaerolinea sp.]|nr:hypothetical protein [Anaerolinea sp.]
MNVETKRHRITLLVEQWLSQARDSRIVSDNTHLPRPARIRALGYAEGLEAAARKLQNALDELGRDGL